MDDIICTFGMHYSRDVTILDMDIDADILNYFDTINRGGLIYPSEFLFNVIQCAYNIFNTCISVHGAAFLKVTNQNQIPSRIIREAPNEPQLF